MKKTILPKKRYPTAWWGLCHASRRNRIVSLRSGGRVCAVLRAVCGFMRFCAVTPRRFQGIAIAVCGARENHLALTTMDLDGLLNDPVVEEELGGAVFDEDLEPMEEVETINAEA